MLYFLHRLVTICRVRKRQRQMLFIYLDRFRQMIITYNTDLLINLRIRVKASLFEHSYTHDRNDK